MLTLIHTYVFIHTYTHRITQVYTQTHIHRQTDRQTDRHTYTDRQTDRQTDTHTKNSYKPSHLYSCDDEERVDLVLNTAKQLQDLSSELVMCAKQLVSMSSDKRGGEEHQLLVEKAEILRRDWSAKVRGCGLRDDSEYS